MGKGLQILNVTIVENPIKLIRGLPLDIGISLRGWLLRCLSMAPGQILWTK